MSRIYLCMNWKDAREGALFAAAEARRAVTGVLGFDPPTWQDLAHGALEWWMATCESLEGGVSTQGGVVHSHEFQHRAQVRSQAGPGALSCCSNASSSLAFLPICSALCCCDVSGSHCLFRCTLAGVAVKLTSLATTEHRVHEQACWGDEGSHWKVRQPEFAGRPVGGLPPTSWFAIWTWTIHGRQMHAGWKLSWMGSLCSEVANWLWTPQLSVLSIVMGPHTEEQRTWMGWFCTELAAGRSEHTQNWWALEDGPALLSWGSRLEVACPLKPHPS